MISQLSLRSLRMGGAAFFLGISLTAQASSPPTLTAAGIGLGFTLDRIVTGFGSTPGGSGYDVLGSAVNSDGNIIINVAGERKNYVFQNLNNQTPANALSSVAFGGFASALAYANGSVWASALGGYLVKLNNDGSVNTAYNGTGGNPAISANQGLWTNPATGHLIAGNPLYDIDVSGAVPVQTLITSSFSADGITVSPDGTLAYGSYGTIVNLLTKTVVGSFGSVSGADGMGVISSSNALLDGNIIVNTTSGNIVMVDVHNSFAQTIIASGGGYGDYTSPDRTTGTLLVSSSNNLLRLGCGDSCGIGAPPPPPPVGAIPEPETYALMMAGLGLLSWVARRRRS